jgi:hypothetical protein
MRKLSANAALAAIIAVGAFLGAPGCVYVAGPGAALAGPAASYYSPPYYDGYVVYYDHAGLPYYYSGGRTIYVPRKYRGYGTLVEHYRLHRPDYDRWYRAHGANFRNYRHPGHRPPPPRGARAAPPPRGGKHRPPRPPGPQSKPRGRGKPPPRSAARAAPPPRGFAPGSSPGKRGKQGPPSARPRPKRRDRGKPPPRTKWLQ